MTTRQKTEKFKKVVNEYWTEIHQIKNRKNQIEQIGFSDVIAGLPLYRQVLCEPEQLIIRECEKKKTNKILVPSFCERKESKS